MRFPKTEFWKEQWREWIKAEMEDMLIRQGCLHAGWRVPVD